MLFISGIINRLLDRVSGMGWYTHTVSLTYSTNIFLKTHSMPSLALSTGDTTVNKKGQVPAPGDIFTQTLCVNICTKNKPKESSLTFIQKCLSNSTLCVPD